MRERFGEQLSRLNTELISMGAMCEDAISACVKYLLGGGTSMSEAVADAEKSIDRKEREIETLCMRLLIQQQPVAGDMRRISSALKMVTDMERIGDQAADIAEIVKHVRGSGVQSRVHIADMARETIKMVTDSVESFVKTDINLARSVFERDNTVDALFDKVKGELVDAVSHSKDDAETLVDYLMIAKYFERIGDHAENIAEWVIFSVTGKHE